MSQTKIYDSKDYEKTIKDDKRHLWFGCRNSSEWHNKQK